MRIKAVIGAGPAGLYFAIKAVKKGLKHVVIYDPRAGNYTRPGHLNIDAFRKAEKGLGIHFWPGDKQGHIKDLERALYAEVKRLGIKIENKRFIRLHEDPNAPGIVVAGTGGMEEVVEADYVFDCTGARRQVIAAVNSVVPESPLTMETITTPAVGNHILAYVKMSSTDWDMFKLARFAPENDADDLLYAQKIVQLRALGWREFKRPRCYGAYFGKNKVCLYFHAPEGLTRDNYDPWVQNVLESYVSGISYQHLPPSDKPRFVYFPMNTEALKQVSYKGKNLPTVIALGDAQIDFDYYLAHGIHDGMGRIDALFTHIEIIDGEIYYFSPEEYLATVWEQLKAHKTAVINEADKIRESFSTALESAQSKFRQALIKTNDEQEKIMFTAILSEIETRQSYAKAKQLLAEYQYIKSTVVATTVTDRAVAKLSSIHSELLKVLNDLPKIFAKEREDSQNLLLQVAQNWKEIGNILFKNKRIPEAINTYNKALEVYNLPGFFGLHGSQECPIYSNLAISYLIEKHYLEARSLAEAGLAIASRCPDKSVPRTLKEKLLFNLLKAKCSQAQECLTIISQKEEARSLHEEAQQLMTKHEHIFSAENQAQLLRIIAETQHKLTCALSQSASLDSGSVDPDTDLPGSAALPSRTEQTSTPDSLLLQNLGAFAMKPTPPAQTPRPRVKSWWYKCSII